MPVFWSQALTNQSDARAAGSVPPITQPKNRPDAIAIRPGSIALPSASTTSTGSVGPSCNGPPKTCAIASASDAGGTGRSGTEPSHCLACTTARSSAAS